MLSVRTGDADPSKQVRLVCAGVHAVAVEHLADPDAAIEQFFAGGRDVGDDQVQNLCRSWAAGVTFLPNMTEHPEPGSVNCSTRKSLPLS